MGVPTDALQQNHFTVIVGRGEQVQTGLHRASRGVVVILETFVDGVPVRSVVGDVTVSALDIALEARLEEQTV